MKPFQMDRKTTPAEVNAHVRALVAGDRAARAVQWCGAAAVALVGACVAFPLLRNGNGWGALGVLAVFLACANTIAPKGESLAQRIAIADAQAARNAKEPDGSASD